MAILEALRLATKELHVRLDEHPRLQRLLSPSLTKTEYESLLVDFLHFFSPIENAIFGFKFPSDALSNAEKLKSVWLQNDLAFLGVESHGVREPRYRLPSTLAGAWGAAYVLEGSALGGQVIARHVKKTLGFDQFSGATYFHGNGAATSRLWGRFCRAIEEWARTQDSGIYEAVSCARDVFLDLNAYLDSNQQQSSSLLTPSNDFST